MLLHVTDPNPSHSLRRARISEGEGALRRCSALRLAEKRFDRVEILRLGCGCGIG